MELQKIQAGVNGIQVGLSHSFLSFWPGVKVGLRLEQAAKVWGGGRHNSPEVVHYLDTAGQIKIIEPESGGSACQFVEIPHIYVCEEHSSGYAEVRARA